MATNPPIVIGPFANVPAPGSGVKSDWAQQITNYVTRMAATGVYTPPLVGMVVGSGGGALNSATWTYVGGPNVGDVGLLHITGMILLGSSGASVPGPVTIGFPPGFKTPTIGTRQGIAGECRMLQGGAVTGIGMLFEDSNATTFTVRAKPASGAYVGEVALAAGVPHTWAAGGELAYSGTWGVIRT